MLNHPVTESEFLERIDRHIAETTGHIAETKGHIAEANRHMALGNEPFDRCRELGVLRADSRAQTEALMRMIERLPPRGDS